MDFNENEDSLSLRVIDPMVGMYHVPWSHIQHTHGAKGVCHKPRDISLCILYQSGHCNAGKRCHQVHADPLYVIKMREIQKATNSCCALHGSDTTGNEMCGFVTPVQGHPNTLRIYAKRSNKSLDVPKMQTGRTDYLEGLIRHTQQPQISIPLEKVCGLHQRSRCLYGQGCKNLHLCRDLWRDLLTHNKWLGEEPEIRKLKHLKLHHQEQSLGKDVINTELMYPNRVLGPDPSYWTMPNHYPNIQYPWITPPYAGPSIVGTAPYVPFYGRPYVSTSVMVAPPVSQTVITTNTIIPQESTISKEAVANSPTNKHTFFSSLSTDGKIGQNIWEATVQTQQIPKMSHRTEWNNAPLSMSLVYEGTQIDTNDRISPIGAPASPIWNDVDQNEWMDRDMPAGANDSREPSPAEWNVRFSDIVGGRGLLLPEATTYSRIGDHDI